MKNFEETLYLFVINKLQNGVMDKVIEYQITDHPKEEVDAFIGEYRLYGSYADYGVDEKTIDKNAKYVAFCGKIIKLI